jgi:hypothetical protein
MANFTEKLNFSIKKEHPSAIRMHNRNRDFGYYYDNLCLYCANNDIDLQKINDDEFMAAANVMSDFGTKDLEIDHYFFWID